MIDGAASSSATVRPQGADDRAHRQVNQAGEFGSRLLRRLISAATGAVIRLSTWGDSTRMARDLRNAAAGH